MRTMYLRAIDGGIEIKIKAVPGASRNRVVGLLGSELKVQVCAPPEKGKANAAIEYLVAKALRVSAKSVTVVSGTTSPHKVVRVIGVTVEDARAALEKKA